MTTTDYTTTFTLAIAALGLGILFGEFGLGVLTAMSIMLARTFRKDGESL